MRRFLFVIFWAVSLAGTSPALLAQAEAPLSADSTETLTIGSVSVEGNYRTRTPIILREMALEPGDTLPRRILEGTLEIDRRKIVNTNLFITVENAAFPRPAGQ